MGKGVSIYLGIGYSLNDNIDLINRASKNGFERIFTSLHIPEADYSNILSDFKEILKIANRNNMRIVADISPRTFKYLNCSYDNLKPLKEMGLHGIRIDFGFTPQEIAEFTKNDYELKIEINASTVTKKFLEEFEKYKPNYNNVTASHNYYPRANTGISVNTLNTKNELLEKYGIEISAFIPSQVNRRGPIYEGLPTLEQHRNKSPYICGKHLFALGVDNIVFGDGMPSEEELTSVGSINENQIELTIELFKPSDIEKKILMLNHRNRPDAAEDVIRSTKSREIMDDLNDIYPHDNIEREFGFITIDNIKYQRYCGELQIVKKKLPKDDRVNLVGKVTEDELFLIDYIKEDTLFKFRPKEE